VGPTMRVVWTGGVWKKHTRLASTSLLAIIGKIELKATPEDYCTLTGLDSTKLRYAVYVR